MSALILLLKGTLKTFACNVGPAIPSIKMSASLRVEYCGLGLRP